MPLTAPPPPVPPAAGPTAAPRQRVLSSTQRATYRAVAECVLTGAPAATETLDEVVALFDDRVARMPSWQQRELRLAIDLIGSRAAALLAVGRPTPFTRLDAAARTRLFGAWGRSRVPQLRTAHQALRRLTLAIHYGLPASHAAIGYGGPLYLRGAQHPWEGPAAPLTAGAPVDDAEPIQRGGALVTPSTPRPRGVTIGSEITADLALEADAVVIGTGAGGAVAAARLAEAGLDVVMLEEGGWYRGADFTEREVEMTEALYADGGLRSTDDLSVTMLQGRAVGGSTTINWLIMLRTPDWVLDEWKDEHGLEGMRAADLAPVFDRIEAETHARLVPDDAHSANNRLILDGAKALGWAARAGAINARGCVRSGFCGYGCRYDAKQGMLQTYVPRAVAAGARLYADVRADRIELRERETGQGRAPRKRVHASVLDRATGRTRRTLTIDAPLVIAAGGAVGTPALLQRSALGGGGVGAWMRLHPTTAVIGFHDRTILANTGMPLTTLCTEFLRTPASDYGFWIECPPLHPSLGSVAAPGFGEAHAALLRRFPQMGAFITLTRDGAERRVSSGGVRVARNGRTHLHYRLTPSDAATVRRSIVAAAELQLANGAQHVTTLHTRPVTIASSRDLRAIEQASLAPNDVGLFSAHVNGTCRIGRDPATSGATPDGERHGVRGLFICDGSLLPTGVGVNPQETIMAMASVIADRIVERWRAGR
ncbi:MAG: GMC family oxidoreductase [Gemmatimonadaceae bacterium]|jgi:choline dehydrogenase-like flavoprotein|nr:GMC family oxidoreductase [Gemmatimonadaceae bacterium]